MLAAINVSIFNTMQVSVLPSHMTIINTFMTYFYLSAFLQIVAVRRDVQSKHLQLQIAQQQVIRCMRFVYCWLH